MSDMQLSDMHDNCIRLKCMCLSCNCNCLNISKEFWDHMHGNGECLYCICLTCNCVCLICTPRYVWCARQLQINKSCCTYIRICLICTTTADVSTVYVWHAAVYVWHARLYMSDMHDNCRCLNCIRLTCSCICQMSTTVYICNAQIYLIFTTTAHE